jgi:hypothetical protein
MLLRNHWNKILTRSLDSFKYKLVLEVQQILQYSTLALTLTRYAGCTLVLISDISCKSGPYFINLRQRRWMVRI